MTQASFEFQSPSMSRFAHTNDKMSFMDYHRQHPWIYATLRALAFEAKAEGKTRIGMMALVNQIRWSNARGSTTDDWKMNNNYCPDYARLLMVQEPELSGMFEVRGKANG
tara:strand:- start:679 stop:1008 length:330 start_codon:yes stop_codon:yes gene_type:complete